MQRSIFLATTLLPLLALSSAFADSTVYAWRDKNGTMTFTDNRALAPKDTKVEVRSYITESAPTATGRVVAQRAFAQRLASELGLGDNLTAEEAADALVKIGIAPRLGRWNLDEPMTRALMNRLRTLTVGAAVSGKIPLQPEQALIAFDSTAALTGIRIRETEPVPTAPAPQPARQAAVPIYIVPTVPVVVSEPVILGGGAIADPFLTGALPTIVVDQQIVNINKNVVNLRPRMRRPQQRVTRIRTRPPPTQRSATLTDATRR
ncbi:MAG: DUF4124 domain-containing protein [Acidiferrobacterales bacterium]